MRAKARSIYCTRKKEIHYLIVGGWNTLFGYVCFALLYYLLSARFADINIVIPKGFMALVSDDVVVPLGSALIVIINNVITVTNNYVWYKLFVFKTKGNYLREYLRFYAVYAVALVFNLIALPLMVDILKLNAYASQAAITVCIIIMSYVANNKFAFK